MKQSHPDLLPATSDAAIEALPSLRQIHEYASNTLLCCPTKIQKLLYETQIIVENFAESAVLQELKIKKRNELLGLYRLRKNSKGRDLILYRCPLILYARSLGEGVDSVVARVTVYEISHRANCVSLRKQWLDKIRRL